jgi:hypothetical protein
MSNDHESQGSRDEQIDEEMARADVANGERPPHDEHVPPQRAHRTDPEAPGAYLDDEDASDVAEPNEPA